MMRLFAMRPPSIECFSTDTVAHILLQLHPGLEAARSGWRSRASVPERIETIRRAVARVASLVA
jgi:hypothetical protein